MSRANDEPLKLWDLETGEKLGEFVTTDPTVGAFHPTEPLLYVPLSGDEIGIYTLDTDDLMEIARSRLTWELTENRTGRPIQCMTSQMSILGHPGGLSTTTTGLLRPVRDARRSQPSGRSFGCTFSAKPSSRSARTSALASAFVCLLTRTVFAPFPR